MSYTDEKESYDTRVIGAIDMPKTVFTRVERSHPHGAHLMGLAASRIEAFSTRMDARGAVDTAWDHFAKRSPAMGLWVAHKEGNYGVICGHGLAFIDLYSGYYVGWVMQLEMDIISPKPLRDQFLAFLDAWAQAYNVILSPTGQTIRHILMSSPRGMETRVWLRHGGFEEYQIICRRPVPTTSNTGTNMP